jgi:hypothetical protein
MGHFQSVNRGVKGCVKKTGFTFLCLSADALSPLRWEHCFIKEENNATNGKRIVIDFGSSWIVFNGPAKS